ncbi:heme exporter protein CcmD [Endozoicomonas montiporae]|uniref:Heme exporter protein D n=1 Tax=Endozoicomonas montiporae CL-33 TaxID=570277 RepID=A0A142BFL2_9GAMM|nr:heme exporter protein CcmD [Endozoicomonas montiporae]AMO57538.1 heme exporter protein D [Endozoicomonas montiporae CL-33]
MYFDSLSSLMDMGGHGVYVWSTYGVGLLVVLYNILAPVLRNRQVIHSIQRQYRRTSVDIAATPQSVSPVQTAGNTRRSEKATGRGEAV